jgi:hypothetical protein
MPHHTFRVHSVLGHVRSAPFQRVRSALGHVRSAPFQTATRKTHHSALIAKLLTALQVCSMIATTL